jgi:FMN reductase
VRVVHTKKMNTPTIVFIVGSPRYPSRTSTLAEAIAKSVAPKLHVKTDFIHIKSIWSSLCYATERKELDAIGESIIKRIERADALVIASPIYMASYSGMLKHVMDLVDQYALRGKPALLCATSGGESMRLVIEHQLLPLMMFFRCQIVPTTIFATERHFNGFNLDDEAIYKRIDLATDELARLMYLKELPVYQERIDQVAPSDSGIVVHPNFRQLDY